MKKPYTAPELDMQKIAVLDTFAAASGDDNDLNASEAWGDDW